MWRCLVVNVGFLGSIVIILFLYIFFFNDTATTEIYTLSLHDALPICILHDPRMMIMYPTSSVHTMYAHILNDLRISKSGDRKSTRLNSSHTVISYAVFCLKKKRQYLALLIIHLSESVTCFACHTITRMFSYIHTYL